MKTLKSIVLGLALLVVCGAAKANNINDDKSNVNYAINTFVDAMTRGKVAGLNDVLDKSAEFSMLRGKTVLSYGKKEMLEFLNSNKNIEQACTTSTSIVESTANVTIVKVAMKYDNFVRNNYVTIANTGNGWKITNVYSVFR
ncbi:nuclear transport factor 2 family protein [Mucilaginibacter sp. BJC16-A38]|uniref:nuclear transport factor 2 family protein n=1 Tax=Mucilaginibacter phenanthrenivorans TaxID=1234842 RepID=UPI002157949A|nr:nuclear transport factor 2 family protein [Mucilaginibacter phenanthrenivorans]MCR8558938.1 nuclear transport factor 2 family protein [Mucilaginibacter phenanthrenivorans]MDP9081738.1 nuclear transport factor 2 family protein [Bacteroidota bacterium]